MKKYKVLIVLIASLLILAGAVGSEYIFARQGEDSWMERIEKRLHEEEARADAMLESFKDSVGIDKYKWDRDLVFAGFRNGEIFFWTEDEIGMGGLYEKLQSGSNFVKINNAFYEVRGHKYKDIEYYALLRIKTSYPYTNKYVKNYFGKFLGVSAENADNIEVAESASESGKMVSDKDGNKVFYVLYKANYKDRATSYILLFCYLLVFLSLFYLYDKLLLRLASLKKQLYCMAGFLAFLLSLRYVMITNGLPASLYRLQVFDHSLFKDSLIASIGDLLLSAFCITEILYITFDNIKIDLQNHWLKRYHYLFIGGFVLIAFLYANSLNFVVGSVIENTGVHLNIARIVEVGMSSVIALVSIILGGLALIIIVDSAAAVSRNIVSFPYAVRVISIVMGGLTLLSLFFNLEMTFSETLFLWGIILLATANRYLVRRDVQRSVYMLIMFLFSIYIVMIGKKYEQYRESTQRLEYATELIEERDYNFEKKLEELNVQILHSDSIAVYLKQHDETKAREYLFESLLELTGYNYSTDITFCRKSDSLFVEPEKELWRCDDFFNTLVAKHGEGIEGTNFYLITDFDGFVSYVGKFAFGDIMLYLRFDSAKDNEGSGYPQILSRQSVEGENVVYPYSYAKYKDGRLIFSSGDFNYYRSLSSFGIHSGIDIVIKDRYSHMLIPVGEDSELVISLHDSIFSLYYMNVLYAFLICILLSSYGLFFNINKNVNFRKGTLKARIKNSIIFLIFVLFVILTAMSIYLNTRSFQERHNAKAIELLKYINKELERLDCVEWQQCPQIRGILTGMSEILTIDINIYSDRGILVATSRPEIFKAGFSGYLVNPAALEQIIDKGAVSYVAREQIGELGYMSVYMPMVLENGKVYVLNVPYFTQNDELNLDIIIMVIIAVNIAIVVMVLAFILSGLVAERVTKPLQMLNDKLKQMRIGGKNEKIDYDHKDEVGALVREYNNMVEKVEESVDKLAKSERESAWREMARQIAHEIKNPLTPMKLNIQFMQRSMSVETPEDFKKRFKEMSAMLIEQIDNMASIASAFSDFAKIPVGNNNVFDISELVTNSAKLFERNIDVLEYDIEPGVMVFADKGQMQRVFVNVLKNAEQSVREDSKGIIRVSVKRVQGEVEIRITDNGGGIPEEIREKIFEPNFTTKSSGMGLGLAICRRILESMNGTITFVSTIGVGTEFLITLEEAE